MDRPRPRKVGPVSRARSLDGFTVIEISVAGFILALIFLMGFTFFGGEQRQLANLTEALDINATIESAFTQLSRDVRASSEVVQPGLIEVKDAPPPFEYEKNSGCLLVQAVMDYKTQPATKLTSHVRYYLDDPVEVADLDGGEKAVTYSLYRQVNGQPPEAENKPLLSGIQELTFYRTKQVPGAPPPNGTGYYVLHLRMKVCAIRRSGSRTAFRGYAAEMDTMVKLRGSL
ncbi:MAG: hypothetical protein HY814_00495 [Candidatus Riflebacteria bacterium]|nr:hypothetical protein [Candidatus Riflebacteria bacterium]